MDKIKQMQLLVAEIGVFFANCDGVYDSEEQKFIENFLKELRKENQLTDDVKQLILNESKTVESIDTIIQMTKNLLSGFNETEQKEIKAVLSLFIFKLIEVDGEIHPNEIAKYNLWKEQIGI